MSGAIQHWLLLVVVATSTVLVPSTASAQSTSSTYGNEFYLGFMRGVGGVFLTDLRVTVGTPSDSSVTFVVESSNGVTIHMGTVTSDAPVVVDIPSELQVTGSDFDNREKGIHIYSTEEDDLLFVLGENFFSSVNHGVFLAYPCLSLGENVNEYEYLIISSDVSSLLYSEFLLVGCEDETAITITPTQTITLPQNTQMSSTALTIEPGMSHEITLGQMQTLLVLSFDDLTGTNITSNKPLTVLSGNECANVPLSEGGCEPFAVQVPPVATWGTAFFLAPFAGRNGPHFFKAVSSNDTSIVFTCSSGTRFAPDTSVLVLNSNSYCYLESTDPIFLVGLSFGGSADFRGDPSISIVSPVDQYVNAIDFVSLRTNDFPLNYISVTVAIEHFNPNSILLDGEAINCVWQEITNSSDHVVGYGCNRTISGESDTPAKHTVSHSDEGGVLSVQVYGFSSVPALGYAYLAGQVVNITEGDGEEIDFDFDFLPFLDLTDFPGVSELDNTQVDPTSEGIVIPDGLIFGDELATLAYVNENGVISFNKPWSFSLPERFPTRYFWTRTGMAVAAFWSDNDIRKEGAVRYTAFTAAEAANDPARGEWLDDINSYIETLQGDDVPVNERFQGAWVLTVNWDHVHPSPHGADDTTGFNDEELDRFNSYQAVIVTNVVRTYAIFSYMCGDIQWSALGRNQAAVVGFNAEGNFFGNHPLSGFSNIGDAVSCTFDVSKRRKRQDDMLNGMAIEVPVNEDLAELVRDCLRRFETEQRFLAIDPEDPQSLANRLAPCPCSVQQAAEDKARYVSFTDDCFLSSKPVLVRLVVLGQITLTQMCCYDTNGALRTSRNEGFVGTMLFYHPIDDEIRYTRTDLAFREACCDIGFDTFCDKYFEQRIVNNCEQPVPGYTPLALAQGSGDPHYYTFDRLTYHFQGIGDYVLLRILPENGDPDGSVFTLQGRLQGNPGWFGNSGVSSHCGLAFGRPGLSFHFDKSFRVYDTSDDEQCVDITDQLPWRDADDNVELKRDPEQTIERGRNTLTATFFESGVILTADARIFTANDFSWIDFTISVPRTFKERTQGFLGNLDGDPSNEFHTRENTNPLPNVNSGQEIYDHLQQHWILDPDNEASFFCADQGRRKRQTDEGAAPIFFDNLNITDDAAAICEGNPSCIFDLLVIGDMEGAEDIAMITLDREKETNATRDTIDNFPPNITAAEVFTVQLGEESLYTLTVLDPGDQFTLTVLGGLPANSALDSVGEGEYVFRWKLEVVTMETLVFVASDSKGASSTFAPIVEVCGCVNGGNCTRDGLLSSNATVVLNCACSEAFSGAFCEEDRNGCSEIQCFEGVECLDVPAPGVGAVCEPCPEGYTGDAAKCYDIDECALDASLCDQVCENTAGSFICSCMDGYQLVAGENQCIDVNECDGVNDCQQLCENTEGSFSCSCTDGFSLGDDGRNCIADVPCGGECSFACAVIDGEEQCFCPSGFVLSPPGGALCVDQDECEVTPCEQLCTNTEGSFECACMSGYELQENLRNCSDIDECFEAAFTSEDLCGDANSQCVNSEGSFECECVPGYEMVNGTCQRFVEPPQPDPIVITPTTGIENSVNYTAPTLTPASFTPDRQQDFRQVTSEVINAFCREQICNIVLLDREIEEAKDLKVEPMNVAIPTSLIDQDELGQLTFTFYIQFPNGFLSQEHLILAVQEGEEQYRCAGFLPPIVCPPFCTAELCTDRQTRRALCTIRDPEGECCAPCRITFCHACYFADEVRPLPGDCDTCVAYPTPDQAGDKCFRRWSVCVRRANANVYPKVRGEEKSPERFKCYEHPCL